MRASLKYIPMFAGALAIALWIGTANAQTVPLNVGGSSSALQFMTDIPLNLCDSSPLPHRYSSAGPPAEPVSGLMGDKVTWTCNRNGAPVIFRYSATGSSDGINKLLQPAGNPASNMLFLNHTLTTGCTGPILLTRPSDNKQYRVTFDCHPGNVVSLPVHLGVSDVQGASFGQTGPLGTSIPPLDDSALNSVGTAVVPFSIYVGKGVVRNVNGAPGGPIQGLSRLEIEAIFNRQANARDWKAFGFGTVTDAAPGSLEATSPIVLCLRNAGSGTKAAFDETLMVNVNETSIASAGAVIFSSSTSGVLSCLANNRRSIGYMGSDWDRVFDPGSSYPGLAYPVRVDGGLANDPAIASNPKRDLRCGRYAYWTSLRLNRRVAGEGADIDVLAQAFVTNAGLQATISIIPSGKYWASDEEMAVFKNADRGPVIWKSGNHPECQ